MFMNKQQCFGEKNNVVYGNLIKWKEGKRLGSGTSGEVFTAMDINKWMIFAVKKLQFISASSGIDKEAIFKLKKEIEVYRKLGHENIVKYIGSEIVNNQFCIYLEYMSGGSICSIYQSYGKLQESTIKVYTK
jgi:serine/threonine protein kinase